MQKKAIVHKVPENIKKQSIESLKVRKETLEYLRKNGFKTINDVIKKQEQIPIFIPRHPPRSSYIFRTSPKVLLLVF